VTVPSNRITTSEGDRVTLEWNVKRPYNYIFNDIQCYQGNVSGSPRIARKVGHVFKRTINTPHRFVIKKQGTRHVIVINDVQKSDAAIYTCKVTCISGKLFHYEKGIRLIVNGMVNFISWSPVKLLLM
jgi:Immunoglobulin V-set domain.